MSHSPVGKRPPSEGEHSEEIPNPGERMQSARAKPPAQYDEFSKALLNLSFTDRNAIIEEIHGVSCMAPDESPQLIDAALYSLSLELYKIQVKPAYDRAQKMHMMSGSSGEAYVNTAEFRLRFLRCELFDTKKAAARIVKYLDLVSDNYGPYALTRPFKLSDLSRDELSFLRGGDYQLLPYRDRSGRRILCIVTNNRDDISAKTRMKILLYLWVVAAEDVESQRKGMVIISYSGPKITITETDKNTKQSKFHKSRVTTHAVVGSAVPMRLCSIHFCLPDTPLIQILTGIYAMALGQWSSRVTFHLGQSIELRYALRGYGIPTELIPSTDTGNVKVVNLKQWIKLRDFLEKYPNSSRTGSISSDSEDAMDYEYTGNSPQRQRSQQHQRLTIVECPGSSDVIFRRGKSMMYHPGNAMFHSLIESRLEEHTKAKQAEKLNIVLSLIQHVQQEKGGRFLIWDGKNNWWLDLMTIPMSGTHNSPNGLFQAQELEIQSKVSYAFRDFKKKLKTRQSLQISKSSTYAFERQDGVKMKRVKAADSKVNCMCVCSDESDTNNSDS